jgi:hypothetical protein
VKGNVEKQTQRLGEKDLSREMNEEEVLEWRGKGREESYRDKR